MKDLSKNLLGRLEFQDLGIDCSPGLGKLLPETHEKASNVA